MCAEGCASEVESTKNNEFLKVWPPKVRRELTNQARKRTAEKTARKMDAKRPWRPPPEEEQQKTEQTKRQEDPADERSQGTKRLPRPE